MGNSIMGIIFLCISIDVFPIYQCELYFQWLQRPQIEIIKKDWLSRLIFKLLNGDSIRFWYENGKKFKAKPKSGDCGGKIQVKKKKKRPKRLWGSFTDFLMRIRASFIPVKGKTKEVVFNSYPFFRANCSQTQATDKILYKFQRWYQQ